MIADYLKLLLLSALICLPGGFIIRVLANKKLIIKDNPEGQKNIASFGKKLMIMSSIVLLIGLIMIIVK